MIIKDLFTTDVTRDIPPVIYFHERSPEKLDSEIREYIITGGYPDDHPLKKRVPRGIHEQYVKLLKAVLQKLEDSHGAGLPASWISGFFGSGKSGFAKLLGCALDGHILPSGQNLAEALLARDRSPLKDEFQEAWQNLLQRIDPLACIFDIGGSARDNEHIHTVIVRMLQERLGYSKSAPVAHYERNLEQSGDWLRFLEAAERSLGKPWSELCQSNLAEDHFSEAMHAFDPERYTDPMSWFDVRAGQSTLNLSANEAVETIGVMLEQRAPGKTLFIVVDEVSQYIHQDEQRMLKLQSFVSALGQRLRGKVWLLVTGQEKLEEESETTPLGKLKDRFPPSLRIHLDVTNIRDVVHRRLLEKKDSHRATLEQLFEEHRTKLKLFAYKCDDMSKDDFVEVYPLLPEHINLLLEITTALRTRSSRIQGDAHAIRGLLQLLGDLFREQRLAEREVGELITLEHIFELQHSSLDSDIQLSLSRIFDHCHAHGLEMGLKVTKAVALLELIQEKTPTTDDLVARCLYDRLDRGPQLDAVREALETLRRENLLSHSEKRGYRIQSSAGAEWERERRDIQVTPESRSELIQKCLKDLIGNSSAPRLKGVPFRWTALYSDTRRAQDEALQRSRHEASITLDLRFRPSQRDVAAQKRQDDEWLTRSQEQHFKNRVIWLVGDSSALDSITRDLGRSRRMLERYKGRKETLSFDRQRLLQEEEMRLEELSALLETEVKAAWHGGSIYFKGSKRDPTELSGRFQEALTKAGEDFLPSLFPHFVPVAISESELKHLIAPSLSGLSSKFLSSGLGIATNDEGQIVANCEGRVPKTIVEYIEAGQGCSGDTLFNHFQAPPFGYSAALIRACLAGLLRCNRIEIKTEQGPRVKSIADADVKELFSKDRPLRRADLFPAGGSAIKARERNMIRKFFVKTFERKVESNNEAIADVVYQIFPALSNELRSLEQLFKKLPRRNEVSDSYQHLAVALDECRGSRRVEETVLSVKKNLDLLTDQVPNLKIDSAELTEELCCRVHKIADRLSFEAAQLRLIDELPEELSALAESMQAQLDGPRPWRDITDLERGAEALREHYIQTRRALLNEQSERVEAAQQTVKRRPGFESLNADQAHAVLRPLQQCLTDTDAEAVAPPLLDLREGFAPALAAALLKSQEHFDSLLASRGKAPVVTVQLDIQHRVVNSDEDLDALLADIRARLQEQLRLGNAVRLL